MQKHFDYFFHILAEDIHKMKIGPCYLIRNIGNELPVELFKRMKKGLYVSRRKSSVVNILSRGCRCVTLCIGCMCNYLFVVAIYNNNKD